MASSDRRCRHCDASIAHRNPRARYCGYECKRDHNPPTPLNEAQRKRLTYTQRVWARRWREEAIRVLGGCCARCAFSDPRALQFDHVNGDGYLDVRPSDAAGGRQRKSQALGTYYKRIAEQREPGRFQLLCANCNWIKRAENEEHLAYLKKEAV